MCLIFCLTCLTGFLKGFYILSGKLIFYVCRTTENSKRSETLKQHFFFRRKIYIYRAATCIEKAINLKDLGSDKNFSTSMILSFSTTFMNELQDLEMAALLTSAPEITASDS